MRGLKEIIARRRPTSKDLAETSEAPALAPQAFADQTADGLAAAPGASKPRPATTPVRGHDLRQAQEAKSHVPRPVAPQIKDQPDWTQARASAETRLIQPEDLGQPDTEPTAEVAPEAPRAKPKIWDLQQASEPAQEAAAPTADPASDPVADASRNAMPSPQVSEPTPQRRLAISAPPVAADAPPASQPRRMSSERVKTRLLGFHTEDVEQDVFAAAPVASSSAAPRFPVGWLVVVDGPGRGASFTLTAGLSTVGRDMDQTVCLDFGDTAISRERHVAIAFDEEENRAYVGHGGKSNIVRLNGKPLLTTEALADGDTIKLGKTSVRYVAFCSPEFSWNADASSGEAGHG